ncbi:hypothetical protein [Actinacidiphila acididurans]|uniref:Uncharacterized protein n=1 Tax=Actinacidiphila acididurans TaxID=2784346 RepID=A0ABS2TR84_9ACTN|nr:hypothetical protein [Actinacidiphila acididurans]MBM9505845.1 hypothetical protein [Actinacidiphila acididurans]
MTAVVVEITTRPSVGTLAPRPITGVAMEPAGPVIVEDVETLAEGATPGCGDDNPYN